MDEVSFDWRNPYHYNYPRRQSQSYKVHIIFQCKNAIRSTNQNAISIWDIYQYNKNICVVNVKSHVS